MTEVKAVEVLNECLGKEFPDDPVNAIKAQRAALVALAALRDEVSALDRSLYETYLAQEDLQARAARLEADNARLRTEMREIQDDALRFVTADTVSGDLDGMRRALARLAAKISAALAEKEG